MNKQDNKHKLIDTDNSVVVTRGKGMGEDEEGKEGHHRRKPDFGCEHTM